MLKKLHDGETYRHRKDGMVPLNFTVDREAALILEEMAPHPRARGDFLSRVLHDYKARLETRREERARLRQLLDRDDEILAEVG